MGAMVSRRDLHFSAGAFFHDDIERGELFVFVGKVVAEMRAAALFALDGGAGDDFGDGQQIALGRAQCASRNCIRDGRRRRRVRLCAASCLMLSSAWSISFPGARCRRGPASCPARRVARHRDCRRLRVRKVRATAFPSTRVRRCSRRLADFSWRIRAAYSPARLPKTSRSERELPPSRFAPCRPAAHSPAAKRPGTSDIWESASTLTPPIM